MTHTIGMMHVYFCGRECHFAGEEAHGLLPCDAEKLKKLVDADAWENGCAEEAHIIFEWR